MKKLVYTAIIFFFAFSAFSQTGDQAPPEKNKEFFLSFSDLSPVSISIAHKRQLKNNLYLRFGLVDMSLQTSSNFSKNSIRSSISYSVGMEAGVEFRKGITENFTFYHGPSISATYGNNISRIDTLAIASVQSPSYTGAIPYSLGMLVKLNDHFLVSAEINPGIAITYRKFSSNNYNISTDFNFSNRFAVLSFVYRL